MKTSDLETVNALLKRDRKLAQIKICGCISLQSQFLWVKNSVSISKETASLCIDTERKIIKNRLIELGVEVDE